ncbi:MAG: hypothetical protein RMK29_05215 [Myxococcales bacterium]|nr:hypothetical protein [Myxococcota bacterium]MDW8281090.1 hypothetical protein [Myxococcales bacterium]
MLRGSEALAMLLSGIRAVQVAPGSPLGRVERLLLRGEVEPARDAAHLARTLSDEVALGLGLGGALLTQEAGAVLLGQTGLVGALGPLRALGMLGEYRSGLLLVDASETDPRAALHATAPLPLLEAGAADELYLLGSLGLDLSVAAGAPVALRTHRRALMERAEVRVAAQPAGPEPVRSFCREEAPYLFEGQAALYHAERRAGLLARLQGVLQALAVRTAGSGRRGVVVAGHLGRRAQARAAGRRLHTLRLGLAVPLAEAALRDFCTDLSDVLVLEEGGAYLLTQLRALVHQAGLAVRVHGTGAVTGHWAPRLGEAELEVELDRFAGAGGGDGPAPPYDLGRALPLPPLRPQLDAQGELSEEPWPLFVSRTRRNLPQFLPGDGRLRLLTLLHGLGRPVLVSTGPGPAFAPGLGRALCDVQPPPGCIAAVAGALSEATAVEGALAGRPLAVAVLSEEEALVDQLGMLDNVLARRDVLHVLLHAHPPEGAEMLEEVAGQLQAGGAEVLRVDMQEEDLLHRALEYLAHQRGPRLLVCNVQGTLGSQISG